MTTMKRMTRITKHMADSSEVILNMMASMIDRLKKRQTDALEKIAIKLIVTMTRIMTRTRKG